MLSGHSPDEADHLSFLMLNSDLIILFTNTIFIILFFINNINNNIIFIVFSPKNTDCCLFSPYFLLFGIE